MNVWRKLLLYMDTVEDEKFIVVLDPHLNL